jgi:hypothetical protein
MACTGAACFALTSTIGNGEPIQRTPAALITRALNAYAVGQAEEGVATFELISDFERTTSEWPYVVRSWSDLKAPVTLDDRERIVAVAALDFGHAAVQAGAWHKVRSIVERSCRRLRDMPTSQFERLWHLASISLAEAAWDAQLLIEQGHARHVLARFPEEGRAALSAPLSRRLTRVVANRPGISSLDLTGELDGLRLIKTTLADLDRLARIDGIGYEAKLRAGMVRFHLGELEESLADLQFASRASDRFVAFLAHLVAGHVLKSRGSPEEAEGEYRAAVTVSPTARSGVLSLAAQLFLLDKREEAVEISHAALRFGIAVSDPWRDYGFADYRLWPSYQDQLHASLRR